MTQTSSSTGMDLFCYNWVLYHITCTFTRVTNYVEHIDIGNVQNIGHCDMHVCVCVIKYEPTLYHIYIENQILYIHQCIRRTGLPT